MGVIEVCPREGSIVSDGFYCAGNMLSIAHIERPDVRRIEDAARAIVELHFVALGCGA